MSTTKFVEKAERADAVMNRAGAAQTIADLEALVNDLRTQYVALLAKMDADFADVTNASVDYATSVPPTVAAVDADANIKTGS